MVTIFGHQYKSFTTVLRALGLPYISPAYVLKRYGSFEAYLAERLQLPTNPSQSQLDAIHEKVATAISTGRNLGENLEIVTSLQKAIIAYTQNSDFRKESTEVQTQLVNLSQATNFPKALRKYLRYSD